MSIKMDSIKITGSRVWPLRPGDVIGHVTIGTTVGRFLLVIRWHNVPISHRCRDIKQPNIAVRGRLTLRWLVRMSKHSMQPACITHIHALSQKQQQRYYTTLHSFNGLFFQDNLGKPAPEKQNHSGKTNLDLLEQETVSGNDISWAICTSAPRARQITMPVPHHSVFYRPDALPAAQPTASKHWSCQ